MLTPLINVGVELHGIRLALEAISNQQHMQLVGYIFFSASALNLGITSLEATKPGLGSLMKMEMVKSRDLSKTLAALGPTKTEDRNSTKPSRCMSQGGKNSRPM